MKRLVFLFSDTGAGHRAAAEAVRVAIERLFPQQYEISLIDPMSRERGILVGRLTAVYGPVSRHAPFLWGAAYHGTNFKPLVRSIQHTLGRGLRPRLRQAFKSTPDLVASFHPMLNHVALDVLPARVPLITVITDWIRFHEAWTDPRAARIVCPSDQALQLCRERGIDEQKLVRTGLPIHPKFLDAIARFPDRRSARVALRLRPYANTVLLAGGGDGTEPLRPYARALAQMPLDLQVLVVCGRNQWLARKIRDDNHSGVYPYGFVDNMPELMLASDLLVTRAGPGMIAEGLACGCPLLLTGYLPGQEAGNVEAVLEGNLGSYVPKLPELTRAVAEWFEQTAEVQESARRRARAASAPEAAFDIARLIASLVA